MQLTFFVVRPDGSPGRNYTVENDVIVFGRSDDCDVVLDDLRVSSRHATLHFEQPSFVLKDEGSTNGTVVDGAAILESTVVDEGALIEFGGGGPNVRFVSMSPASSRTEDPGQSFTGRSATYAPAHAEPFFGQSDLRQRGSRKLPAIVGSLVLLLAASISVAFFLPADTTDTPGEPTADKTDQIDDENTIPQQQPLLSDLNPQDDAKQKGASNAGDEAEPSEPPRLSNEQLIALHADRCVWIGLSVNGSSDLAALYSGWLVAPQAVATTAHAAVDLKKQIDLNHSIRIFTSGGDEFHVTGVKIHPAFGAGADGDYFNVALLQLKTPSGAVLPAMTWDSVTHDARKAVGKIERNATGSEVVFIGYRLPSGVELVSATTQPNLSSGDAGYRESIAPADRTLVPALKMQNQSIERPSLGHGQLAVSRTGDVLGIRLPIQKTLSWIIPVERIRDLL